MEILIKRAYYPGGTNGNLSINGKPFHHTIELPDLGNQHGISCIPEGRYECVKHHSEHLGDVLMLLNVPHRDMIYIHKANDALKELKGCIAPVMTITGEGKGSDSHDVFDPLLKQAYAEIDSGKKVFITITH